MGEIVSLYLSFPSRYQFFELEYGQSGQTSIVRSKKSPRRRLLSLPTDDWVPFNRVNGEIYVDDDFDPKQADEEAWCRLIFG